MTTQKEWEQIRTEFIEWDNATHSNASQRQIMDWFEVKFTERESKYKEFYEVMKELIYNLTYRGEQKERFKLRQKITKLEKELGL